MTEHFGVRVQAGSKNGLRLKRENYARINKRRSKWIPREMAPELWDATAHIYEDDEHRFYIDEWCEKHRSLALQNFDLNMAFFESLDPADFDAAIQAAVKSQRGMREVHDLNEWDGRAGVYIMVLDDYKQAYVGTASESTGVMRRIREHWSSTKAFDRLLWGSVTESILPIDAFRALDTTRIFAGQARDRWSAEMKLIDTIPRKYLLNRIAGGSGQLVGFAAALGIEVMRTRDLVAPPSPRPGDGAEAPDC